MSVIQKFMASLDVTAKSGTEALDEAVQACSDFKSLQDLIDHAVSDCSKAGSGDVFLKEYCGIDLDNTDTGAITGSDAGGGSIKTAESVVPESGTVDKTFTSDSFTVNGLTFRIGDLSTMDTGDPESATVTTLSEKQLYIWQALHSWWAKAALDLNAESFGDNFSFTSNSSATVKTIYVYFKNVTDAGYFAMVSPRYYESTNKTYALKLKINMKYAEGIVEDDMNGSFKASGDTIYFDRTLAHEFTHAVMAANLPADVYIFPTFVREGLAELTCGIDDKRKDAINNLASNPDKLKKYLSDMSREIKEYDNPYSAGYILFRYLNKQASTSSGGTDTIQPAPTPESVSGTAYNYDGGNSTIYAGTSNVSSGYTVYDQVNFKTDFAGFNVSGDNLYIYSNSGTLTVLNARGNVISYGDAGGNVIAHSDIAKSGGTIDRRSSSTFDVIVGANNADNQIYASSGGSNLWGGVGGNDTLIGGNGYDAFNYKIGSGADVIENAGDNDVVNLNDVSFSQITTARITTSSVGSSEIYAEFADGGSLKVKGNSKVGFLLDNVTYYVSDYSNGGTWGIKN